MEQVMFPVRVFGRMGVKNLILTNAAGGTNMEMRPGSLMLITDHMNCMGVNPLRGVNDSRFGQRFPDMSAVYDRDLQLIADAAANEISRERFEQGVDALQTDFLKRGVYCALVGSDLRDAVRSENVSFAGADAVGMSTVPKRSRPASGDEGTRDFLYHQPCGRMTDALIDHAEVMETGARVAEVFKELLKRIVTELN
jgi:purine-nucleoside phosphorylase